MVESSRHYSNDLCCLSIKFNLSSHNTRIASKTARPKAITQNNYVVSTWLEFLRSEHAAMCRRNSQHGKEISGCGKAHQTFGCLPRLGQITAHEIVSRHLFKHCILIVLIKKISRRVWPTLRVR